MRVMAKYKRKTHDFENCPPAQDRFTQPGAPIAGTARPLFDQAYQSSEPFPRDVGTVKEGDKYAFRFESHTDGKKGRG